MTSRTPFWPRRSPNFLACRVAARAVVGDAPRPIAVGLSGGADSLALTAALVAEGHEVTALCVVHGLQSGSAAQARRAAEQARGMGAAAEVVRVNVAKHGSLEAAARAARYRAFADWGEVAVAHTTDDQAETLLLGALRGNPSGMAPRAGRLVRPFLPIRRADTVGACAELGVTPWEDPMNGDPAFRRVALRTRIIPALTELLGGDAVPPLAQTADRIAAAQSLLDAPATTSCDELAALPSAVRRSRIHAWLVSADVRPNRGQLAAIERLITHWNGQVGVDMAGGVRVRRVGGELTLERRG